MKEKKKKEFNLKSFIIALLRRGTYRFPYRDQALKAAKVAYGTYTCNACKGTFRKKDIRIDHVQPVVDPLVGFIGFDEYIKRLYPMDKNAFQILCDSCHTQKTSTEAVLRKHIRQIKKEKENAGKD